MASSIYSINKGVNKSIEFKGLKAQYIWYLGAGLIGLLVLFAILYIAGANTYLCLVIILGCGTFLFTTVYRLNNKYGQYGMMKKAARRMVPTLIKVNSRKQFIRPANGKVV
jgi:hypothetical protein